MAMKRPALSGRCVLHPTLTHLRMIASRSSAPLPHRFSRSPAKPNHLSRWLAILSIGLVGCSLIGHVLGSFYFFELFSHFSIQYLWLSYILLGLWLLFGFAYWKAIPKFLPSLSVLLLVSTAYLNTTPWVAGDFPEDLPILRGDLRVLHANVLYSRNEYATTVAMLHRYQSDLYVLQEMTPQTIRLVTSQVRGDFPYWFACRSKQQVWTLVGSRTPFRVDQKLARNQHIISLTTTVHGRPVSFVTVHPHTPIIPAWFRERNKQLTEAARITRQNKRPTVLIGDFNISPFSPVYQTIFQPSAATGKSGILTAARQTKTQPTWPRFLPFMMIPIDHAFVNSGFKPLSFRTLTQPGSDHRALVVDLLFQ